MSSKTTKRAGEGKVTPLMKQYFQVKSKHPDAIVLFRVGDFYETFGEDAVQTSEILGIVLTHRNNGGSNIELAGFPYHSLDLYLPRLVRAGMRVAICEQLEKPSKEKKIVKRGITEVVTPGTALDAKLLDHKENNFLGSLHLGSKEQFGVAFADISTGEFLVSEGNAETIDKLLQSLKPAELLFSKSSKTQIERYFGPEFYSNTLDEWIYTEDYAREKLLAHFGVQSLKGFSIEELNHAQVAAGGILHYLGEAQHDKLDHFSNIKRIHPDAYLWMDRFTIRNLELTDAAHSSGNTLIDVLDHTISPMGSRLLRKWLLLPLKSLDRIKFRHAVVRNLVENGQLRDQLAQHIQEIGDLERIVTRLSMGRIHPREFRQLLRALRALMPLRDLVGQAALQDLRTMSERIDPLREFATAIGAAIQNEPPTLITKGGVIRDGFNDELDELRYTIKNSKELLLQIQQAEAERTGIQSLKIGFNNVFGYYLEVTNKYKDQGLIPEDWVRKQTLTNSERYITDELKKLEQKILGAEEQILQLEQQLYAELIRSSMPYVHSIQRNARAIAQLDCLICFAGNALRFDYVQPEMHEGFSLEIHSGRHPVIERQLPLGQSYVPNDVRLNSDEEQILMITGPNMSGKSAVLRQTALISIMAQMGSFVPAKSASLGVLDRLFTRVGASDNISSGESTFMVEMNETASIMNNLSSRSLVLLDEIGRGTSTYDGISIAWSVAEYLHDNPLGRPMTLFATHYHELNALANEFKRIRNYHITVQEVGNKVLFLRKLVEGGTEHSFGIHVAKMAGMPRSIVRRAEVMLQKLEAKSLSDGTSRIPDAPPPPEIQLDIFGPTPDPLATKVKAMIAEAQINQMTPVECMLFLVEMQKLIEAED